MPTYEYACRECGEHVEVVQSFREDPLTVCALCGGTLRKVFSAAGIVFKGSGYYVTDSRKVPTDGGPGSGDSDKSRDAKGDGKSATAGGEPDGKPADGKPAAGKPAAEKPAGKPAASSAESA